MNNINVDAAAEAIEKNAQQDPLPNKTEELLALAIYYIDKIASTDEWHAVYKQGMGSSDWAAKLYGYARLNIIREKLGAEIYEAATKERFNYWNERSEHWEEWAAEEEDHVLIDSLDKNQFMIE